MPSFPGDPPPANKGRPPPVSMWAHDAAITGQRLGPVPSLDPPPSNPLSSGLQEAKGQKKHRQLGSAQHLTPVLSWSFPHSEHPQRRGGKGTSPRPWGKARPSSRHPTFGSPHLRGTPQGSHLHLAVYPVQDFRHFGVHAGFVSLAAANAPAGDSCQVPAVVLLADQGPPAVSLQGSARASAG